MVNQTESCDLFVIGGGSGGVRAARIAASHGARVMIAEEYRYGGTCVIRGCVPKKLLVYGSGYRRHFEDAAGFGWTVPTPSFDWSELIRSKDAEIDRLNTIYLGILERAGVQMLHGRAAIADRNSVVVSDVTGDRRIRAETILIATGGRPFVPPITGGELTISSNEAFHLPQLPKRIAIAGGGYIAIEFAHIFAGFGAKVLLFHRRDLVLRGFDDDVRTLVTAGLAQAGIELHMHSIIDRVEEAGEGRHLYLSDGGEFDVDAVMMATGRRPNTNNMGLAEAGVELGPRGGVIVDARAQSSVDSIYAVGDCTDAIQLTPVAIREGQAFADRLFGDRDVAVNYDLIPTAIFSQPPAATVGVTELAAQKQGLEIKVFESDFRPMKHTLSGRDERILVKLVVRADDDRVIGVHMVGEDAPEIVQAAAIALQAGATKADFDATLALHPSTAEELVLMSKPVR